MNRLHFLFLIAAIWIGPSISFGQENRTEQVRFDTGTSSATITGKIAGEESITYKLNAKEGQFLSVSLRPDNLSANFNIYIPGRGLGDEALFASATGGSEYRGQLYKSGDHSITVFLMRNAARRSDTASFDIVFTITDEPTAMPSGETAAEAPAVDAPAVPATQVPAAPVPSAGMASGATSLRDQAWFRVTFVEADHGQLLERQANLPPALAESPVAIAILVLQPDLDGTVTQVDANYDNLESPQEATIVITDDGILDDDLFAIRHSISTARNSNGEWRVIGYQRGELRRNHFK